MCRHPELAILGRSISVLDQGFIRSISRPLAELKAKPMRAKARTGGNQSGLICVTGSPDPWAPRMMRIKRGKKQRRKNVEPRDEHLSIYTSNDDQRGKCCITTHPSVILGRTLIDSRFALRRRRPRIECHIATKVESRSLMRCPCLKSWRDLHQEFRQHFTRLDVVARRPWCQSGPADTNL
jgi:hypothetical protein